MASSSSSSPPPSASSSTGPAGLGQMASLSEECSPLKHRYDSCFNAWFENYLVSTTPTVASQKDPTGSTASLSGEEGKKSGGGGFWSRGGGDKKSGAVAGEEEIERRRRLRDELENKCGATFREYQTCVKKALAEKDILPLLATARELNPFPFPSTSSTEDASKGNEPFPYPQATPELRRQWEKQEGW